MLAQMVRCRLVLSCCYERDTIFFSSNFDLGSDFFANGEKRVAMAQQIKVLGGNI
jgi:hypothetical protein